jgi:hypothetical protein
VCQRSVRTREVSDKCPAGLRQLAFTGFSRSLRFDTLQHHRYRIARTKVFQRRFESHGRDKQCAVTPRTSRSHRIPCPPKCPDVVETSLLEQPRWQLCDHGSARFPLRSSTSYAAISTAIGTPNSTGQRCAYRAPATNEVGHLANGLGAFLFARWHEVVQQAPRTSRSSPWNGHESEDVGDSRFSTPAV